MVRQWHVRLLPLFQVAAALVIIPYLLQPGIDAVDARRIALGGALWLALAVLSTVGLIRHSRRVLVVSLWLTGVTIACHALLTSRPHIQVLDGLELLVAGIFAAFLFSPLATYLWLAINGALYLVAVALNPSVLGVWVAPMILVMVITTALVVMHLLREVHSASVHDALTGALNRYGLSTHAVAVRRLDERKGTTTSLAFLDADGFKAYNDSHGHKAGDQLLADTVAVLATHLRASDLVCRLGGDEFVVVFPDTTASQARTVLDRLAGRLPAAYSIGVAEWPPGADLEDALDLVDDLMYRAKRSRRETAEHDHLPAGRE